MGFHPRFWGRINPEIIEKIKKELPEIVRNLEILGGAEFREPENAWVIPVAYQGLIVGHIKIFSDGLQVIPDFRAEEESQYFAR